MHDDWQILTHGGAGSDPAFTDATDRAAEVARVALGAGEDAIEAACRAVAHLEDDDRFNAGTGSNVRADGETVEMDAACTDDGDRFGAVACLERVRNPVLVALEVVDTPHLVLAGKGALSFARSRGYPDQDPSTKGTDQRREASDTVGCVVRHGGAFAAALSSGGTREAMVGRVGDVPLPGCGLRAGPAGAVAATGDGEAIARQRLADRVYERLTDGLDPETLVEQAVDRFAEGTSVGLIVVDGEAGAAASSRTMAWSQLAP